MSLLSNQAPRSLLCGEQGSRSGGSTSLPWTAADTGPELSPLLLSVGGGQGTTRDPHSDSEGHNTGWCAKPAHLGSSTPAFLFSLWIRQQEPLRPISHETTTQNCGRSRQWRTLSPPTCGCADTRCFLLICKWLAPVSSRRHCTGAGHEPQTPFCPSSEPSPLAPCSLPQSGVSKRFQAHACSALRRKQVSCGVGGSVTT